MIRECLNIFYNVYFIRPFANYFEVMVAASFWSLIAPGIELAEKSGTYGKDGKYAFVPVAIGFALGGVFVFLSDKCIARLVSALHIIPFSSKLYYRIINSWNISKDIEYQCK